MDTIETLTLPKQYAVSIVKGMHKKKIALRSLRSGHGQICKKIGSRPIHGFLACAPQSHLIEPILLDSETVASIFVEELIRTGELIYQH